MRLLWPDFHFGFSGQVATLVCLWSLSSEVAAEDWLRRLHSEAPGGWQHMAEVYSELESTYELVTEAHGKVMERVTRDVLVSGAWARIIERDAEDESVLGLNSKYAFRLRRPISRDEHRLVYCGRTNHILEGDLRDAIYAVIAAPHFFGGRSLQQWAKTPGFAFESALSTRSEGKPLLRVQARYRPDSPPKFPEPRLFDAVLELDPNRHWCLHKSQQTVFMTSAHAMDKYWTITTSIDYQEPHSGIPMPLRVTKKIESDIGASTSIATITSVKRRKAIEEDFSLSAFGLPEPPGITWKKPTPWWLWISLGGVGMLVLGAGLGWLRKRYAARAAV